ncbi:MAG: DUF177 domain-containing protein [Solirubrobacterales bacterium]|nr:DUF177 domain-containing protein [Solirubrobacterales bacterium]
MTATADEPFDLGALLLVPGEGKRLDLTADVGEIELGGNVYRVTGQPVPVRVDLSRTVGDGWAFRLAASVDLEGPCTRCLAPAAPHLDVEAREASRPGGGEDLQCPYLLEDDLLDVSAWLRDSIVLNLPSSILCHGKCPGLCEECGVRLATAGPDHFHEKPPDPRWAALRDLEP